MKWTARSQNVGIPRKHSMDLDKEEIPETHNFYVESTHGSLKNIIIYHSINKLYTKYIC